MRALFTFFLAASCLLAFYLTAGDTFRTRGEFDKCQIEAAQSLLRAGTLSSPAYYEFHQFKLAISRGTSVWQDCFAETIDGTLLPKHSLLLPILTASTMPLGGETTPAALSILVLALLIITIISFGERYGRIEPLPALAVMMPFSQLMFYVGGLPYDTLSALLTVLAFLLASKRPLISGFTLGVALFVKPSLGIFFPFLLLMPCEHTRHCLRRLLIFGAGFGVPVATLLMINNSLFGSALTTAYHRLPHYIDGTRVFEQHPLGLNAEVFFTRWFDKFFDSKIGVIPYNLSLTFIPFALIYCARLESRRAIYAIVAASLTYSAYIFSYEQWDATHYGNRFLMPAIALLLVPVCVYVSTLRLGRSIRHDRRDTPRQSSDH